MSTEQFHEIADRVFVARHEWLDVNVTAVVGERGILLVDTLGSTGAAQQMLRRLRSTTDRPVVTALNSHAHVDHLLGNRAVQQAHPGVTLVAQEAAADAMVEAHAAAMSAPADHGIDESHLEQVRASPLVLPDHTFASVKLVDLGDRQVELVFCGRGHTAGDVVVRVPEADVLLTGDLVEQGAPPSYGDDCYPLEWPATVQTLMQLTTAETIVVPGHGRVVDQQHVHDQRQEIGMVAETIHQLASQGVPEPQALETGSWPFPTHTLAAAVRRGYQHLPLTARRLPMA